MNSLFCYLDPVKARPRSCVDSADPSDVASTAQKRWSGVLPGSKLVTAFQRLGCDEDEYTEDRYSIIFSLLYIHYSLHFFSIIRFGGDGKFWCRFSLAMDGSLLT